MIKLAPKFNKAKIRKMMQEREALLMDAILSRLMFAGEQFIAKARSANTYKDQTGNLRSSIGYVVLKDGVQLVDDFKGKSEEGVQKARNFIARIIGERFTSHKGFALICVAGMEYAAAVESKGYDVITGSTVDIERTLKASLQELTNKYGKAKL